MEQEIEDVMYIKSADICAWGELLKSKGYQASVWVTGSDEYDRYKPMAKKVPEYEEHNRDNRDFKDACSKSFYVEEVKRNETSDDFISTISATKVREALAANDKGLFAKMMPKGADKFFDEFKEAVLNAPEPKKSLKKKVKEDMKSLFEYIKENLVTEGGHVFDGGSDPIKKEYIKGTLDRFIKEFVRIFPKAKNHFENPTTLGSVGKKDVSGDIDLAIDEECFTNLDDWDLEQENVDELYAKYKKRARTSTPEQLMKRAIIASISQKVNDESELIRTSDKSSGNGVLFCQFPQYDESGKELDLTVQIDINFGKLDWLKFAYYSDSYAGNVKGLHRTQLMLHMFANKGYVFSHNYGVKDKETQEIVANSPEEAVKLLNKLYGLHLTDKILENYHKLQEYLREHLKEDELDKIYDIYLKTLDSTRCDIPEDLQEYWIKNKARLGLKGQFLPDNSRLQNYK